MDLCCGQSFSLYSYFYIYLLYLLLNEIDVCNFDNNTTPAMCHKNLAELLKELLCRIIRIIRKTLKKLFISHPLI